MKRSVLGYDLKERLEEIYFPGDSIPIYLDKRSESLKVIQHMRDEAHRFGLSKHRNRRSNSAIKSELEQVEGVGPKSIEKLLKHFGSVKRLKESNKEEIKQVVGEKLAEKLTNFFQLPASNV